MLLSSCGVKLTGNVYKILKEEQDLIKGIRIDDISNDTLLVKYKFSDEMFLDANFVYDDEINCYKTTDKITFGAEANKKSIIYLTFDGEKHIYLEFIDILKNKKFQYQKIYKKRVNLKTHRDSYYAEDGFSLN